MNFNISGDFQGLRNWLSEPIVSEENIGDPRRLLPFLGPKESEQPPTLLDQARRTFRMDVSSRGVENTAVVYDGEYKCPMVIGYHRSPFSVKEALDQGPEIVKICNRMVPVDYGLFWATLEEAWNEWSNEYYRNLIQTAAFHFHSDEFGRQAFEWGPSGMALGYAKGVPNVVSQGELVSYQDYGWLLDSIAHGRPQWRFSSNGAERPAVHPLEVAYSELRPREDHFVWDGQPEVKNALYWLVPYGPEQVKKLQDFPVDIFVTIKNVNSPDTIFFKFVVWARGTQEDLQTLEGSLHQIGKMRRVPGYDPFDNDIDHVVRQLWPGKGSVPPPSLSMPGYKKHDWLRMLDAVVNGVDDTGVIRGNLPLGKSLIRPGKTVFLNWETVHMLAIAGPTGTGKTTLGMLLGLLRTHRVVALMLTPAETDMPGRLAEVCGGCFYRLEVPRAETPEEYRKGQEDMEDKARGIISDWAEKWKSGIAQDLPFVIMPTKKGTPALRDHFVTEFLIMFRSLLQDFYEATGKRTIILIDDLISLSGDSSDPKLGKLTSNAGRRARDQIHESLDTFRKSGGNMILTVHSPEEFRDLWSSGFWRSIPYCVWMMSAEERSRAHGKAYLIRPAEFPLDRNSETDDITKSPGFRGLFDYRLPPPLMNLLEPKEA